MSHRTSAYWPARILLAIGFIATVGSLVLWFAIPMPEPMFGVPATVLGLPGDVVIELAGPVASLIGFAWMVRIFRGARDEPPTWRYRDR